MDHICDLLFDDLSSLFSRQFFRQQDPVRLLCCCNCCPAEPLTQCRHSVSIWWVSAGITTSAHRNPPFLSVPEALSASLKECLVTPVHPTTPDKQALLMTDRKWTLQGNSDPWKKTSFPWERKRIETSYKDILVDYKRLTFPEVIGGQRLR